MLLLTLWRWWRYYRHEMYVSERWLKEHWRGRA